MVSRRELQKVDKDHVAVVSERHATKPKPRRKKKQQHYVLILDRPEIDSLEEIANVAKMILQQK